MAVTEVGISLITAALAPILTSEPMFIFSIIEAPIPIQDLSPICTDPAIFTPGAICTPLPKNES